MKMIGKAEEYVPNGRNDLVPTKAEFSCFAFKDFVVCLNAHCFATYVAVFERAQHGDGGSTSAGVDGAGTCNFTLHWAIVSLLAQFASVHVIEV